MYHLYEYRNIGTKVFAEPYRSTLMAIIRKIGYDYNIGIVELECPVDHIHMVVRTLPTVSLSNIM